MRSNRPFLGGSGQRSGWLVVVLLCLCSPIARASSPEDIATARRTAAEGIGHYQAGRYAEALDRLTRAQALYDVPVHLLYIARCQVQLQRWVEAAETYRKLMLRELEPGAPAAFREAVDRGKAELQELLPRIPTLKIVVRPESAAGFTVTIGGQPVARAAIGLERPTDPGVHEIAVSVHGTVAERRSVTLAEGAREEVVFELHDHAEQGSRGGSEVASGAASAPRTRVAPVPSEGFSSQYFFGLRLAAAQPTGQVASGQYRFTASDADVPLTDYFRGGAGLELRGGWRFHPRFQALLFIMGSALEPGEGFGPAGSKEKVASASSFGLGVVFGTRPRELGWFAELDLALKHDFSFEQRGTCTTKLDLAGPALRLGGGMYIPTRAIGTLTPMAMLASGQFSQYKLSSDCPVLGLRRADGDIAEADQRSHSIFFLGIGSEFYLGKGER